jgi:hypothetical protein
VDFENPIARTGSVAQVKSVGRAGVIEVGGKTARRSPFAAVVGQMLRKKNDNLPWISH